MKRYLGISFVTFCSLILVAGLAAAKQTNQVLHLTPETEQESPVVGDVEGTGAVPSKALQDTVWIADWNFDGGAGCTTAGWVQFDQRIFNDGSNHWVVNNSLADSFGISGNAAMLRNHNVCWDGDGYGNDADYSVIVKYRGSATVSFTYLSDTEPEYDYVLVEADSAGASEGRVNYAVNPKLVPDDFRTELARFDDLNMATASFSVPGATLPDFGQPATTHELYIRLTSDGAASDEDGIYESRWNAGLVIDNIVVTGALAYSENFEGALNPNVTLVNSAVATPFGIFARAFSHITDNDKCTEDPTCAWLGTDPLRIAFFPNMAFGPGSAVIRNWLDDIYVSPWVSLASTPSATGTVLSFRRFPGNLFAQGRIVQGWRVRAKLRTNNTDTTTLGDSIDCVSIWGHSQQFNSLDPFVWGTSFFDMTTNFSPLGKEIQVSFRNADWQHLTGIGPPATLNTGPGPFVDRVRIGRRVLTGPVFNVGIDTRTQAQDCFPTVVNGIVPGEHHSPDGNNIFGTCAFSYGTELGINSPGSPSIITGDSIKIDNIVDARGAGGVNLIKWYGAITSGPHTGKAPAPYTVSGGFFEVQPDSCRLAGTGAALQGQFFVDLDDTYFRGGDALKYFWYAGDAQGGRSSAPGGITNATGFPANATAAEVLTVGLYEVNYLPTINWDPAYLAAIAGHASGDIDPSPGQIANSSQKNCILYYQHVTSNRRSGPLNRTSFMYTLDRLGYRGYYDVYDVQGYGNTNNQLGGRANVAQCSRYALIIEDDQRSNLVPNIPDGNPANRDTEKVNQAQWYRDYLAQGASGLAGVATLWVVGETTAFEKSTNALFTTDMGLSTIVTDQGLNVNPNVSGLGSFTFTGGGVANFAGDVFALNGGCPTIRNYDGATNAGTAVMTHRYTFQASNGPGAIIMNKNVGAGWNTIWQGFGWFDIRNAFNTPPNSPNGTPDVRLMRKILNAALPVNCIRAESATDLPDEIDAPRVTSLHQNVPNPFNPTTTIKFDLSHDGNVKLQVFDVAGHLMRTLADQKMAKGFNQAVTWNGLDEKGLRVPSGVYFYQLVTDDYTATKKMVMLK
jgi:hypothetical protein